MSQSELIYILGVGVSCFLIGIGVGMAINYNAEEGGGDE